MEEKLCCAKWIQTQIYCSCTVIPLFVSSPVMILRYRYENTVSPMCDRDIPNLSFDVDSAGGDSDRTLPPRFQRGRAPLAPTDTPKLWEESLLEKLYNLQYSSMNVSHVTCYDTVSSLPVHVLTSLQVTRQPILAINIGDRYLSP